MMLPSDIIAFRRVLTRDWEGAVIYGDNELQLQQSCVLLMSSGGLCSQSPDSNRDDSRVHPAWEARVTSNIDLPR